jgi:hypothetical protein
VDSSWVRSGSTTSTGRACGSGFWTLGAALPAPVARSALMSSTAVKAFSRDCPAGDGTNCRLGGLPRAALLRAEIYVRRIRERWTINRLMA